LAVTITEYLGNYQYVIKSNNEQVGLTTPSTNYRSFWRRVFPVTDLYWYWQPNQEIKTTEKQYNWTHQSNPSKNDQSHPVKQGLDRG